MYPENITAGNFTNRSLVADVSTDHMFDITIIVLCTIISCVGVFGNFATILKVIFNTTFHRSFYTAVACLAASDLLSIIIQYVRLHFYSSFFEQSHDEHTKEVYLSLLFTTVHSSAAHLVLLAYSRYALIAHPVYYRTRMSPRTTVIVSIVIWIASTALGISYGYYNHCYYIGTITPEQDAYVQMVLCLYIFTLPIVFFVVSHHLQRRSLKKSLVPLSDYIKRKQSAMILVIIIIYTVCLLPYCTSDILFLMDVSGGWSFTISSKVKKHLVSVGILFMVINYSINPFVYLHFSRSFRKLHTLLAVRFLDGDASEKNFRYKLRNKCDASAQKTGGDTWP